MESHEVPVLLVPSGEHMVVVAEGMRGAGWAPVVDKALSTALACFKGRAGTSTEPGDVSARYFAMRDSDLGPWDSLGKSGSEGYAYGTLRSSDGHFAHNVSIKEVDPASAVGTPTPVDPAILMNAVAVAQLQASIERLAERIEDLMHEVEWTNDFLAAWQEGDVLAALETINEIHRRYLASGRIGQVDYTRVLGLEQVLRSNHRRICKELSKYNDQLHFRTYKQAKAATLIKPKRIDDLLALESYVLQGLTRLIQLQLATKHTLGELASDDVDTATDELGRHIEYARELIASILSAETRMRDRDWHDRLFTHGLVGGALRDEQVRDDANARRRRIQSVVRPHKSAIEDVAAVLAGTLRQPTVEAWPSHDDQEALNLIARALGAG